jgi:uncharacterized protein (DUF2236 family)
LIPEFPSGPGAPVAWAGAADAPVPGRVAPHVPASRPAGVDGLFGPGPTWQINAEMVVVLGWARAILLQIAHPKVAAGVFEHSHFREGSLTRLRRLQRTIGAMLDLAFGTVDQAVAAARRIDAIHGRVRGQLREPEAAFPPGTAYQARDVALLRWVHATVIDSQIRTYEFLVGPLPPAVKDEFCAEVGRYCSLLGVPDGYLPESHSALVAYLQAMLGSGEIRVGDNARELARHLLACPLTILGEPLFALVRLPVVGLLPEPIRSDYGLPWDSRRERQLLLLASACRLIIPHLPDRLHRWPAARRAERRLASQSERLQRGFAS